MFRLNVETLDERTLPSVVTPTPPSPATIAFAAPVGSDKGSFAGDGWSINDKWMTTPAQRPAQPNGIIAILIGL